MTTLTTARGVGQSTLARQSLTSALVQTARPKQWSKNVLVFAAPAAAGALLEPATLLAAAAGAVVFSLAAAATYFINDAWDVEVDRGNPRTSTRPVASGRIAPTTAVRIGGGLGVVALTAAIPLGWGFAGVILAYLALTLAYSSWLKHQPVLDILAVALGFLLRAVAGAVVTGLPASNWFLLVALFGSLFLVTAKRAAEQRGNEGAPVARATLGEYPAAWLQQVLTMSLTGTVLAYAAWAVQYVGTDIWRPALTLSVLPFMAALLRYSLLVARGHGEAPEDVLASDRFLLLAAAVWMALLGNALYVA